MPTSGTDHSTHSVTESIPVSTPALMPLVHEVLESKGVGLEQLKELSEDDMREKLDLNTFGKRRRLTLALHGPIHAPDTPITPAEDNSSAAAQHGLPPTPATAPPRTSTAAGTGLGGGCEGLAECPVPIAPFSAPSTLRTSGQGEQQHLGMPCTALATPIAGAQPPQQQDEQDDQQQGAQQQDVQQDQPQQDEKQQGEMQQGNVPMEIDEPEAGGQQGQMQIDAGGAVQQEKQARQELPANGSVGASTSKAGGAAHRPAAKRAPRVLTDEQLAERQIQAEGY